MNKLLLLIAALALVACGTKPKPIPDSGPAEDAGVDAGEVDAGRQRGDEPPSGYSTALELPPTAGAMQRMGVSASMALDQFNHPMVAGIFTDPNNDGLRVDDQVVFTRWNGVDKKYQTPVTLAPIGEIDVTEPNRQVSISRDSSTGAIGVAFINDQKTVRIAVSDDEGLNWSLETANLPNPSGHLLSNPALVLDKGAVYLAYFEAEAQCGAVDCGQVVYRKRIGKAAYSDAISPAAAGSDVTLAKPIALAVDSAGNAAVAYFSGPSGAAGGAVSLLFWRPSGALTQKIADSGGVAISRAPSVSLAFAGDQARVAYHLPSSTLATGQLWYATAADAAGTAFTPLAIPRNSANAIFEGTQWFQALALDSAGKVAIAAYFAQTPTPQQCTGGPKLARSSDGTSFTVCRPDMGSTATFGFAGLWIGAAFHKPGKITLSFTYETNANPSVKGGVIVYREP